MYTFLLVLFIIVCILLILIILLQSSKASGMELFGGGTQNVFGTQTGDILTKATTILASLFLIGTIILAIMQSKDRSIVGKIIRQQINQGAPPPQQQPASTSNTVAPGLKGVSNK